MFFRTNKDRTVQRALTMSLGLTFVMSTAAAADPLALDLSSEQTTVSVTSEHLQGQSGTTINNGGATLPVSVGSNLTAAQFVALTQVISGGVAAQNLALDSAGRAVGGTFNISSMGGQFNAVNIPSNVIAIANQQSGLNISGNLTTAGTLFGYGTSGSVVSIQAGSINVLTNGSITTQIPTALQSLFTSTGPVGLNLTSTLGSIINSGSITSSGVLNLVSAGGITNNANAIISGVTGTNILAASGIISNAGNITSALGNINFATLPGRDLILNNVSGNIAASLGAINVRNAAFCAPELTTIMGGNLAASQINLFGGDGMLDASVDSLLGTVNVRAQGAHVSSLHGDLNIGIFDLHGDPLLAAIGGNLNVGFGQQSFVQTTGQAVVLLARNNISIAPGLNIMTNDPLGNGGNVVMVAGYEIQLTDPTPAVGDEIYTLVQPSLEGGNINASGSRIFTAGLVNGGAVQLSAHGGIVNAGIIDFGTSLVAGPVIKTVGFTGSGGSVAIHATGGILMPSFTTPFPTLETNGPVQAGYTDIQVAQPIANSVSFAADGSLISGFFSSSPLVPNPNPPVNPVLPPPPPPNGTPLIGGIASVVTPVPPQFVPPGSGVIQPTDSVNVNIGINNGMMMPGANPQGGAPQSQNQQGGGTMAGGIQPGAIAMGNGSGTGTSNGSSGVGGGKGTGSGSTGGSGTGTSNGSSGVGGGKGTGSGSTGSSGTGTSNGSSGVGGGKGTGSGSSTGSSGTGTANGSSGTGTGNGSSGTGTANGSTGAGTANGTSSGTGSGSSTANGGSGYGSNTGGTAGSGNGSGTSTGGATANNGSSGGKGSGGGHGGKNNVANGGQPKPSGGSGRSSGDSVASNGRGVLHNPVSSSNNRGLFGSNGLRAVGNVSVTRTTSMMETTHDQLRMSLITRSNQMLTGNLGGRGNFMMGTEGTSYSNQRGVVVLHTGRIHADTGADGGTIMANGHRVKILPNSAAVVDVDNGGNVSVMSVGGEKGCSVALNGASQGDAVALAPGQVVTITEDLASDDLIDVNGQTTPVSGGITHLAGKKVEKTEAAVWKYMNEELLPAASTMNIGLSARVGRNRFLGRVAATIRKQDPGYQMPVTVLSERDESKKAAVLDIYSSEGTKFERTPDSLNLVSGMLILRAPDSTTVKTEHANVVADKGALFAVENQEGVTRVRALSGPGDVTITAGDKSISLNPGEEVMIASHPLKRQHLNPSDGIGRRTARHFKFGNGVYGAISDFSIASLIHGDSRLKDFISQRDNLFDGILKTAVAVEIVTASRGRYSSMPKATAVNSDPQSDVKIAAAGK